MPMTNKGLNKLMEECGALVQVAAKKAAYMHTNAHPDGSDLKRRMEEEIADTMAAASFVIDSFGLDELFIQRRLAEKYSTYKAWDADPES